MPRELIEHLMDRKKALNAEKFEIDKKLSALPPEHLWVVDKDPTEYPPDFTPEEAKVKESFLVLNDRKLRVQAQLHRADLFRQRHPNGILPPFCVDCFVDHDVESLMVEVKSDCGNGIRQFECPVYKHVLRVNPV